MASGADLQIVASMLDSANGDLRDLSHRVGSSINLIGALGGVMQDQVRGTTTGVDEDMLRAVVDAEDALRKAVGGLNRAAESAKRLAGSARLAAKNTGPR